MVCDRKHQPPEAKDYGGAGIQSRLEMLAAVYEILLQRINACFRKERLWNKSIGANTF